MSVEAIETVEIFRTTQGFEINKPTFLKKLPDYDGLIIPGIKMTNTGPFSVGGC